MINKMIEGNSMFKCHSFAAKMVNGDSFAVQATGNVQCGAVYSAGASVSSGADVDIGLLSGMLQVSIVR